MPLPYRLCLQLLRPAARPATLYRADDGGPDFAQVWRWPDGRELLVETLGAGECCRLYKPLPLVRACDLRRELMSGQTVRERTNP
jgi:hypothetical protein